MATPKYFLDKSFVVRSYESGVNNQATPGTYCNYFQEIAGEHANALGIGIHSLQSHQITWMLARLRMGVRRWAAWGEALAVRTWPSGFEGRLIALRDFQFRDSTGGLVAEGISEWVNVDLSTRRLVRMPAELGELAPEGTPRAGADIAVPEGRRQPFPESAKWAASLGVRRTDLDFNDHVNNVHYVEWALECLPGDWLAAKGLASIDVSFKAEALLGDTVRSEAAPLGPSLLAHRIVRAGGDNAVLAILTTGWSDLTRKN